MLQKYISETACGGTAVNADFATWVYRKNLESFVKLKAAAAYKGQCITVHFNFCIRSNRSARFVHTLAIDKDKAAHDCCFGSLTAFSVAEIEN